MSNKKLRVGLLLDSFDQPAWEYQMLERIRQSDYADIVLLVMNDAPRPVTRPGLLARIARIFQKRGEFLYQLFFRYEQKRLHPAFDPFEVANTGELLEGIPRLEVVPKQGKFSDWILDDDVEKIRQQEIDVFIRLGFRLLRGAVLQSAACGVWSYHHGDNRVVRGGPAGFWEAFEGHPWTGMIVQVLNEDFDNGQVLYRSYSATEARSPRLNRSGFYWKSVAIIPRKLQELHALGRREFQAKVDSENENLEFYSNRSYTQPSNLKFLQLMPKFFLDYVKRKFRWWFTKDQWILMYDFRDTRSTSFWRFKPLLPPKGRFWADPFIVFKDEQYYVFLEDGPWDSEKGRISVMTLNEDGSHGDPVPILEKPYHLSYPFVFESNGDYFMIPESSENRTIDAYRCVEFPGKWEHHSTLMSGICAVDSTLFQHGGKWWLFANIEEHQGISTMDELFLFYSDDPLGNDWTPHPKNPVISDVRQARPAGRVFEHRGEIYRPSQNSSGGYGRGLCLNRIERLTETDYKECQVSSAAPGWEKNIVGLHTYNHEERLTIIDAKLRRWKW